MAGIEALERWAGEAELMLVARDSALRRLPTSLDPRQVLFLDGIRYCLEMTDIAYGRLARSLCKAAMREKPRRLPRAFLDAWSIVDSANRLRVLVNHMPGMKLRAPGAQLVTRALAPFEDLRNGVQHLDGTIQTLAEKEESPWGGLTWAAWDPRGFWRACWAMPGAASPKIGPEMKVGDWRKPIDRIELTAYTHTVSLTMAYQAMASFVPVLERSLKEQFAELPTRRSDTLLQLHLEPRPRGTASGQV